MSDLTQTGELRAGIRRFQDGRYADFTIKCGAREWKAHKIILSAISHVLEKACFGGFKESIQSELDLSVYSEAEVDALVAYIYTGNYRIPTGDSTLEFHIKMCIVGDYFSIVGLEQLATRRAIALMPAASAEQVIEAAALTANAPDPTKSIQASILLYTSLCTRLYEGEDCIFSRIAAVNTELATEIARGERALAIRAAMRNGESGEVEQRIVCPQSDCGKTFLAAMPPRVRGSVDFFWCCHCGRQNYPAFFREAASETLEMPMAKRRKRLTELRAGIR